MPGVREVPLAAALFLIAAGASAQPSQASLTQRLNASREGFTVAYPSGWAAAEDANVRWIVNVPAQGQRTLSLAERDRLAQIFITTENRRSHADAVQRLREIQGETDSASTFLEIGGWPALVRSYVGAREMPGDEDKDDRPDKVLHVTTAIAAGSRLIRLEGRLPPDAPSPLVAQVRAIEASTVTRTPGPRTQVNREIQSLRSRTPRHPLTPPAARPGAGAAAGATARTLPVVRPAALAAPPPNSPGVIVEAPGLAQRLALGNPGSEAEIAVSANGKFIVTAQQFQFRTSNDGGLTFPFSGTFSPSTGGDTSLAFAKSGNFYEATINNSSTSLNLSTNNGQTFTFRANAYTCPTSGPNQCNVPDQEHIAADRFNGAPGGDQIYSAWRQLNGTYGITCSSDSGQNWGSITYTNGDLPRITVGQDGFVYVVYQSGNNVMINKYSSCTAGLAVQSGSGFPLTVATVGPNWVNCPVPGLDRCNNGNNLSSFTVAVDDTNAKHVYVAYAQNTVANVNENIIVQDSTDAGVTWPAARITTINAGGNARRFMPWLCSIGGAAYATWYDRRAATATSNDLTDYYAGGAAVSGGNLAAVAEFQVNTPGSADAQCLAGNPLGSTASWPCVPRAVADSQSCPQPQRAGLTCKHSPPNSTDSNTACDVIGTVCPAAETCQGQGLGGCPKYGDYNGNACAAGRLYSVWASATPPPGQPARTQIDLYFASKVVCCTPQIQAPASVSFPATCAGAAAQATVNICNTGKADLNVSPITSSNPQFSVATPSSGYPVTIGQGACFPFGLTFTPSGSGVQTGTLTVPSDDPVNPAVTIPVKGIAGTGSVATLIASGGDFGEVCPGLFRDLALTLNNSGACNLIVSNITSSSPDFLTASVISYPLTIAPGASLDVAVRFDPSVPGAKSANLTIASNDPVRPSAAVPVHGTGGQPAIATVTADNGDFGSVCAGEFRDLNVTISNSGTCPLRITNISTSSPEFKTAQVLSYPLTVAPGASIQVPIRYQPTSAGSKTTVVTIASDDPATPSKTVTLTARTDPAWICHPPKYAALNMAIGPTFGPSRTGDWTFSGKGRFLAPITARGTFGVQAEGEYMYYPLRQEAQFDGGLLDRWRHLQVGLFGSFRYANLTPFARGGSLGQAAFTFDYLFHRARLGVFVTKGFRDNAVVAGLPFTTLMKIADQVGVSGEVRIFGGTYLEGDAEYLRRHAPGPSDTGGFMLRVIHPIISQIAVTGEVGLNESYLGHDYSGRVVFGLQFGHFVRPRDFIDRRHPLGTIIPRLHYGLVP